MRTLSNGFLEAINSQTNGDAVLALVTISHPSISTIRIVNNSVAVNSGGNTFQPYVFDLVLHDDTANGIQSLKMTIDNVNREITEAIRTIGSAATIRIQIVLASSPNTVEIDLQGLKLRNVEFDENWISGELMFEERLQNAIPRHTFTPVLFEGMFR